MCHPVGKHFNHSLDVPNLNNNWRQCISKIIHLNMYELYSNGICLVPPGAFTIPK